MSDFFMDNLPWFIGGLLVLGIAGACADATHWSEFSAAHNCKKVGEISGSWAHGGKDSVYVPGKTGWACDDGVTYWR